MTALITDLSLHQVTAVNGVSRTMVVFCAPLGRDVTPPLIATTSLVLNTTTMNCTEAKSLVLVNHLPATTVSRTVTRLIPTAVVLFARTNVPWARAAAATLTAWINFAMLARAVSHN